MRRTTLLLLASLAMLALLAAAPANSTPTTGCRVTNQRTGVNYSGLGSAMAAASSGDTLSILNRCDGSISVSKDLTLSGQRPKGSSLPTIAAFPFSLSSTVTVGVSVTLVIKNLTIPGGSSDLGAGIFNNQGVVTLNGASVSGNHADNGGGIFNNSGTLTLNGGSRITGNTATSSGGGVFNDNGTVVLNGGSTINGNSAGFHSGGVFGTVTLAGNSSVYNNTPDDIYR
jgi:hypothetical protein